MIYKSGLGTPILTPFGRKGNVAYDRIYPITDYAISNGTDAIIAPARTGQFQDLNDQEVRGIISIAGNAVDERVPFIAATGRNDIERAMRLTEYAAKSGADGALVQVPTGYCGGPEIVRHYSEINRVGLPFYIYISPDNGTDLSISHLLELAGLENAAGLKYSGSDFRWLAQAIPIAGSDDFAFFNGRDECIYPALGEGAAGTVSGGSNVFPRLVKGIIDGHKKPDRCTAAGLQDALTVFIGTMQHFGTEDPTVWQRRAFSYVTGVDIGPPRRFSPFPEEQLDKLACAVEAMRAIEDSVDALV